MSEFENENDQAEAQDQQPVTDSAAPAAEATDPEVELMDKVCKAGRLLRARRASIRREEKERAGQPSLLVRALTLLQLKPKMEQKEMSDLLGVKLRDLDSTLAAAEVKDLVARVEPEEEDMRKIVVMADADSLERAKAEEAKGEALVPGLSAEDSAELCSLLDKVIEPLEAMGLDENREDEDRRDSRNGDERGGHGFGGRGGRDDRRSGDRGGYRGGRDDHGDRRSGGYHGGNRGFGGRDQRDGGRGGYRGGRGGGYRGGNDRGDRRSGGYRGGDDRRSGGYRGGRN